jgi:hypothetical protein
LNPDPSTANEVSPRLLAAETDPSSPQPVVADVPQLPPAGEDGPSPIQFSLKSLLVLTTLSCAAFAVVSRLSLLAAVAMVWLLLLLAAHVLGNAWGSRATARSTRRHRPNPQLSAAAGGMPPAFAPRTHLGTQATLGLSMAVMVGVGAALGAVVGLALIWRHNHGGLGPTGILLGSFSSGVIGAFLSFLTCSCLKVSAKAWRQAARSAGKQGNSP